MLVYLASPYSCPTKAERKYRFEVVCRKAAQLMLKGYEVFCPIAHSHPIEVHGMDHLEGHYFWLKQDFAILKFCDKLMVYKMPRWETSKGVDAEISFAILNGIPIEYIEYDKEMI